MLKLSVIILNYNTRYFLELCLHSVVKALENLPAEIIVVDNASSDDSVGMLKQLFPEVRCILNQQNIGFAAGNNIGAKAARGSYICFLNPDTLVGEDTFETLLQVADSKSRPGALGPRLIDGSGHFLPESKRRVPSPTTALFRMLNLNRLAPKSEILNAYYAPQLPEKAINKVEVLVGACFLVRKSVYEETGGWDEVFFMYGEDIDLSYRLTLSGFSNYYVGTTNVLHFKGESALQTSDYQKRFAEAMQLFYKKHYGRKPLFRTMVKLMSSWFSNKKKNEDDTDLPKTDCMYIPQHLEKKEPVQNFSTNIRRVIYTDFSELQPANNSLILIDVESSSLADFLKKAEKWKTLGARFAFCTKKCTFMVESAKPGFIGKVHLSNS